ncbi:uncharacterized protein BJX67DRAFT_105548 [Aspergillus lucknowensis]|uniref:SANT domain-containing protein n=1 Tax=Aspergillus lucknowensis TaxID=176173 RepID=A0ABR4LSR2_9EURO
MSSSSRSGLESDDDVTDTSIAPRAERGSRSKVLRDLRSSLSNQSVEAYGSLFNEQDVPNTEEDSYNLTQDGIVVWTPQEKQLFYHALDRNGRDGIREIAASVESKSELEVQEYIRLLQKGVRRQHFNDTRTRLATMGDIPAAAEISEECCKSLDEYAELLGLAEQAEEDIVGKLKHKNLWIINRKVAKQLEISASSNGTRNLLNVGEVAPHADTQSEPVNSAECSAELHAASDVFKMTNWIDLSERLFMNFGGPRLEDNWVNVAFKRETPSMTADAFTSFYDIALGVTSRLVQATHFFAASRVRRSRGTSRPSARAVRSSDVKKAARALNMRSSSSDFWIGLARRCSLDVVDPRHTRAWGRISLDHDEVEALLSRKALPKEPYEMDTLSPASQEPSDSSSSERLSSLDEDSGSSEDEHAEAVDRQNSAVEEQRCWVALGKRPPDSLDTQTLVGLPPRPTAKRKTMQELVGWRDQTLPRSEWEEYGYETVDLEREFKRQPKRARRETSIRAPSSSKAREQEPPDIGNQMIDQAEFHIDDSEPEIPLVSPKRNSRSSITRRSSRNQKPVSYTLSSLFNIDAEMEIDSESEREGLRNLDNRQARIKINSRVEEFNGEDGDGDDEWYESPWSSP